VRLPAAQLFAQDVDAGQIAGRPRVSTKSVYQWRCAWQAGGKAALASKAPAGNACRLDEEHLARLRRLGRGPAL
jgi:putative transposase